MCGDGKECTRLDRPGRYVRHARWSGVAQGFICCDMDAEELLVNEAVISKFYSKLDRAARMMVYDLIDRLARKIEDEM